MVHDGAQRYAMEKDGILMVIAIYDNVRLRKQTGPEEAEVRNGVPLKICSTKSGGGGVSALKKRCTKTRGRWGYGTQNLWNSKRRITTKKDVDSLM